MKKRLMPLALAVFLLLILTVSALSACSSGVGVETTTEPIEATTEPIETTTDTDVEKVLVDEAGILLSIEDPAWEKSDDGSYYQLLNVRYCTNVVNEKYQSMNIYVPAPYLEGGECAGYTALTAPVVLQNNNAGWRSGTADKVDKSCIENGFVFVSAGSRSRDAGEFGKAPCAVVDLKSAVRTLRLNAGIIPGDMERIISTGTSGGGQMSSILGASGNMREYYEDLYANGAPGILLDEGTGELVSTISDSIFGCMAFCPIADINNADLAYAWMRFDSGENGEYEFTAFQTELEKDMALAFTEYINGLGLKNAEGVELRFDEDSPRSGSMYDAVLKNLSDALNSFVARSLNDDNSITIPASFGMGKRTEEKTYASVEEYIRTIDPNGSWIEQNSDGTYRVTDLAGFITGTVLTRNKDIPGFDTFDLSAENDAFGLPEEKAVHYSASIAAVLEANYQKYEALDGFDKDVVDAFIQQGNREDIIRQTYLMNATAILLNKANGTQETEPALYWRTRNGTADEHTSFTVAYDICVAAEMAGSHADYALVWSMGHGNNEGESTGTFANWVHSICGGSPEEIAPVGDDVAAADSNPVTSAGAKVYTYSENNGFIDIDWTLTLKEDGTYILNETSEFFDNSYTGSYTINGDTVECGPMGDDQPGQWDWANPEGFSVLLQADSFEPVR